jgi:hypothetical protein
MNESTFSTFQSVGEALMNTVTGSQNIWIILEAIDALMDVFAQDSNNSFLWELDILNTLQTILPQIKKKVW